MIFSWVFLIISILLVLITFLFVVNTKRVIKEFKVSGYDDFEKIEREIKNWLKTPTPIKKGIKMRIDEKPLGDNNYIIAIEPNLMAKNPFWRDYIYSSKDLIYEIDNRGIYLVRPKLAEELQRRHVLYHILARYPLSRERRQEIRKKLKANGISTPI